MLGVGRQRHHGAGRNERTQMRAGRRHDAPRRIGLLDGDGRGERHTLLDAGTELRFRRADEIAIALPRLARLHDSERLAPGIEPVRSDGLLLRARQHLCGAGEKLLGAVTMPGSASSKPCVATIIAPTGASTRAPSSSTPPTRRSTPGEGANHPQVSKEGAIITAPVRSTRSWVGRRP